MGSFHGPSGLAYVPAGRRCCETWEPAGRTWLIGGAFYTTFFVAATPDSPVPDCGVTHDNGTGVFAARSYHSGGVNILIADGSVRYVRSGIAQSVWIAMGTREAVSWLIRRPRRTLGRRSPAARFVLVHSVVYVTDLNRFLEALKCSRI